MFKILPISFLSVLVLFSDNAASSASESDKSFSFSFENQNDSVNEGDSSFGLGDSFQNEFGDVQENSDILERAFFIDQDDDEQVLQYMQMMDRIHEEIRQQLMQRLNQHLNTDGIVHCAPAA